MGILQGLLVFLRKSAGKLVQAIFGWAVLALFGTVSEKEKTLLSVVVGAAAVWPLLLVGVFFPRVAAFVLALVPIPKSVSAEWIRAFWIAAAALVPLSLGIVLARRGKARRTGPRWKMALQAVPITAAVSASFLTAFVTAPIRRLGTLARRREELTIPLLVRPEEYEASTETLRETLEARGLHVRRAEPPWLLTAPQRVLEALGGRLLGDQIPKDLHFYRNEDLDVAVAPSGVTLQGEKKTVARAHGLICEKATLGRGLQTVEAEAQRLERLLKDVRAVFAQDREAHRNSAVLLDSIDSLSQELERTPLDFDDFQILYREILQVSRAIEGKPQLFGTERSSVMEEKPPVAERARRPDGAEGWDARGNRVSDLSTPRLVSGLTSELRGLIGKEIALAKAEIRIDWKTRVSRAKWLGLAAVLALCVLNLLFVAAALFLAKWVALPVAALVVAGALAGLTAVFAILGKGALEKPLEATQRTLQEGWAWAKNRIA